MTVAVVGIVAFLALGGTWIVHPSWSGGGGVLPLGAAPPCVGRDARVALPNAPHGVFVLDPPIHASAPYWADVHAYLLNSTAICGADFQVHWSDVDRGAGASPRFNFSSVDSAIAPWAAAGRVVNLIFQTVGYAPNETWVPPSVLRQVGTIQCPGSSVTPLFWQSAFVRAYQGFLSAAVHHFEADPSIGYLRFGLGIGGETIPVGNLTANGCEAKLNATGFTIALWESYLGTMLDFERSLNSSVALMVALNDVLPGPQYNVTASVADRAARDGIGIGIESLMAADVVGSASNGTIGCRGTWCAPFARFAGTVPLETQTFSATDPSGMSRTGALPPLLRLALQERVQIFELFLSDALTALDPSYPAYASGHFAYAAALDTACAVLGSS